MAEEAKKPKKKAPGSGKEDDERYFPQFVPLVTASFQLTDNKDKPLQLVDAYLLGLIGYCEKHMSSRACTFSSYTIADKMNVSRLTIIRSVKKLEVSGYITKKKQQGRKWALRLQSGNNLLPVSKCYQYQNVTSSGNNLIPVSPKSGINLLPEREYIKENNNNNNVVVVDDVNKEDKKESKDVFYNEHLSKCVKLWEDGKGKFITPFEGQQLAALLEDFPFSFVYHALEVMFKQKGSEGNMKYLNAILENWQGSGLTEPWKEKHHSSQSMEPPTHEETEEDRAARIKRQEAELLAMQAQEEAEE